MNINTEWTDVNSNLSRFRIRLFRRLRRSRSVKKSIGVSPQVIVDTLNAAELAYLSQGKKDDLLKTIL